MRRELQATFFNNMLKRSTKWFWLFLALSLMSQLGCTWKTWRDFRPVKGERPVTMFDEYKLRFYGRASGLHNIDCEISFINKIVDTTNLDTIPIFVIDNFCFEGNCLDSVVCHRPESVTDIIKRQIENGEREYFERSLPNDLLYFDELNPVDYSLENKLRLPETCKGRDVAVTIHASLVDRVTGDVITTEAKRVQFEIKKKTRPDIGY